MGDKRRYDLIGLDDTCLLPGNNLKILSPDITSIIDAFDNNRNPMDLFLNVNESKNSIINERLNYICEYIETFKLWFDRTLIPSLQTMNSEEIKKCIPLLCSVDSKVLQLASITRKTKKVFNKKKIARPQNFYEATCPVCNKFYFLKKSSDWIDLENHEHVAEIFSRGDLRSINVGDNDNITDNCNEMHTVSLNKERLEENTKDKIAPNATKFLQNSLPLCLYNARVRNILYPLHLTSNICSAENNYQFYTVQAITSTRFQCLVCKVDMHQDKCVYSHIFGGKHRNKLSDRYTCSKVKNYHVIFSNLPQEMQIHQVVFRPSYKLEFLYCKVCALQIDREKVVQHISTDMHSIRLNTKRFSKYNFFDDMLKSVGINTPTEDEEISDVSIRTQLIYNSDSKLKTLISRTESSSNDGTQYFFKVNNSTEEEDSEEETSEMSSVSQSVTEEILPATLLSSEPRQGPSNINLDNINKEVKKTENNNFQTNGSQEKENNKTANIKHNIVPAFKDDPDTLFDFIENRYQIHVAYIKFINCVPHCTLCMTSLPKTKIGIKNHFISPDHKKNAEIHCGKQKYFYYCDVCFKYIENEYTWSKHLDCIGHKQRIEAIQKNKEPKGGSFKEYECTLCFLVLFGNNTVVTKHLKDNFGMKKKLRKPKEIKLPPQMENLLQSEQLFAEEIYKLSKESMEVLKQIEVSWNCCKGIEKALEPIFGECKAYPFGSRVSGLGNLVSDLDVFVDTGLMYEGIFKQDADSQAKLVTKTAQALKKHKDFVDVFAIPSARTPIVQVFHRATGLDCDLSFRHGLSVENTEFLRLCIDVQPKLKTIILFLKRWLYFCKLNDKISTYALSMMCIFYFQQKELLPSVKCLRIIDPTESKVIAGWQTFCYKKPLIELNKLYPQCNVITKDILIEFFDFYLKFNFSLMVVCPLLGYPVLKSDFYEEKGKRLPEEMKTYVAKINESEENEVFRSLTPMCIQDPFDLSHNLTKACPVDTVHKFIRLCQLSFAALCKKN